MVRDHIEKCVSLNSRTTLSLGEIIVWDAQGKLRPADKAEALELSLPYAENKLQTQIHSILGPSANIEPPLHT